MNCVNYVHYVNTLLAAMILPPVVCYHILKENVIKKLWSSTGVFSDKMLWRCCDEIATAIENVYSTDKTLPTLFSSISQLSDQLGLKIRTF